MKTNIENTFNGFAPFSTYKSGDFIIPRDVWDGCRFYTTAAYVPPCYIASFIPVDASEAPIFSSYYMNLLNPTSIVCYAEIKDSTNKLLAYAIFESGKPTARIVSAIGTTLYDTAIADGFYNGCIKCRLDSITNDWPALAFVKNIVKTQKLYNNSLVLNPTICSRVTSTGDTRNNYLYNYSNGGNTDFTINLPEGFVLKQDDRGRFYIERDIAAEPANDGSILASLDLYIATENGSSYVATLSGKSVMITPSLDIDTDFSRYQGGGVRIKTDKGAISIGNYSEIASTEDQ